MLNKLLELSWESALQHIADSVNIIWKYKYFFLKAMHFMKISRLELSNNCANDKGLFSNDLQSNLHRERNALHTLQ